MELPILFVVLLLAVFVAGFTALIFGVVVANRKKEGEKRDLALSLGFHPIQQPPPGLLELFSLGQGRMARLRWRNGYAKETPDASLYLASLVQQSGESSSTLGDDTLILISPSLALPTFLLLGQGEQWKVTGGRFKGLFERMLTNVLSSAAGLRRISFPERPDFDERFWTLARDEAALRRLFTSTVLDAILQSGVMTVRGSGQALAVSFRSLLTARSASLTPGEIADLTGAAQRLLGVLGEDRPSSSFSSPSAGYPSASPGLPAVPRGGLAYAGPVTCPACGVKNGAGSTTCAYCGAVIYPAAPG